jgi:RHS repeat-associated protein
MRRLSSFCLLLLAACSGEPPPAPLLTHDVALTGEVRPGATRAQVTVDASGQASVQLALAPLEAGNGLGPSLALTYSSGSEAFGNLGYAWGLAPQSAIRRCPASKVVDGQDRGLSLDDADRACLDGQRLIAVSGAYFADGSSYRLEREDGTLVKLSRRDGEPGSWTVLRKSGEIGGYGTSAGSRQMHPRGQALEWKLETLSDRSSNVISFSYQHDAGDAEVRLSAIDYGGNQTSNLAPYRRVSLRWADAANPTSIYVAGHQLERRKRLERVELESANTPVVSYRLEYRALESGAGELLTSVQECFADGSCYAPTRFEYTAGALSVSTTYRPADDELRPLTLRRLIDVDGDGWDDVVTLNRSEVVVERAIAPRKFGPPSVRPSGLPRTWNQRQNPVLFYDLDADGRVDVLTTVTRALTGFVTPEATGLHVLWGSSAGFEPARQVSRELGVDASGGAIRAITFMADADRDGRPDLFAFTDAGLRVFTLRERRLEVATPNPIALEHFKAPRFTFSDHPREVTDVNGDGFPDVVGFGESAVEVSLGRGFSFDTPTVWTTEFTAAGGAQRYGLQNHLRLLSDANGDGLPDLIGFHQAGVYVGLNTGASFAPAQLWLNDLGVDQGWRQDTQLRTATDLNGDGWLDFVGISQSRVRVVLGRGAALGANARAVEIATSANGLKAWDRSRHPLDFADLDSDGLSDLAFFLPEGLWSLPNGSTRLRLTAVEDGHGLRHQLTYRAGNSAEVYRKTRELTYPQVTLPSLGLLVTSLTERSGPQGTPHVLTYRYENGVIDRAGYGFLGFEVWTTTDAAAETEHRVTYSLDGAGGLAGLPLVEELHRVAGSSRAPLSRTETRWESRVLPGSPAHRFTFPRQTVTVQFDDAGGRLSTTTQEQAYDERQQLTSSRTTITDDFGAQTVTTQQSYGELDAERVLSGRPTSVTVTSSRPGQPEVSRSTTFRYDADGRLLREVRNPGTPVELRLIHDHGGNPFGFVTSTTRELASAEGLPSGSSVTRIAYDARGYIAEKTDALGFKSAITERDPRRGLVLASRDVEGRVTRQSYDVTGALETLVTPEGLTERIVRERCDASCPTGAVSRVRSESAGSAPTLAFEDSSGRVVREESKTLGGHTVRVDRTYAFDGQVTRESASYQAGAQPRWTEFSYDGRRRLVQVTRPDGTRETLERSGNTRSTFDARGHRTRRTVDSQGLVRQVTDARGGVLKYEYDAANRLTAMVDPAGNRTQLRYDALGRRTQLIDPTVGTTVTRYNGLDLPVEVIDAAGHITRTSYDLIGRPVEARAHAGEPTEERTRWRYDSAPNGKGQLAQVDNAHVSRSFSYDALGRLASTEATLDGRRYATAQAYDQFGRPSVSSYPSGLRITNVYDADGFVTQVRNAATGRVYSEVLETYPWGAPRKMRHGNGLVTTLELDEVTRLLRGTQTRAADGSVRVSQAYGYDAVGNLTARGDGISGATETFGYDELDRLVKATRSGAPELTLGYDAVGNITQRSDLGQYSYGASCDGVKAGPFAVTAVGTRTYCYDVLGRVVRGNGRTLSYAANGRPARIIGGSGELEVRYGPDGERVLAIERQGDRRTLIRTPFQGYQELSGSDGEETRVTVGGVVIIARAGAAPREEYQHLDQLGSLIAVTDESGAVIERATFDPWGLRKVERTSGTVTRFGFTGHEQLDSVGLVHMGGRVYDPEIGRFVSPDPFVQDLHDTQSVNRYSYVLNNPLSATDPSGFISMKSLGKSISGAFKGFKDPFKSIAKAGVRLNKWVINPHNQRMVAAIVISCVAAYYAPLVATQLGGWSGWTAGMAIGGGGGFASGYVASDGNLDYARRSALSGMAFFAIGQAHTLGQLNDATKAIAHGVAGGASSAASGGSFQSGFTSGLVSEAIGHQLEGAAPIAPEGWSRAGETAHAAVTAAVIGGITSELTGGKFEDAALTSAMGALFNGIIHRHVQEPNGNIVRETVYQPEEELCGPFGPVKNPERLLRKELIFEAGIENDYTIEENLIPWGRLTRGARMAASGRNVTFKSVDELSQAAAMMDRNGLTKAGRALQKHGSRAGSVFPSVQGKASYVNQLGQDVVDDILTFPGARTSTRYHKHYGDLLEVHAPDGRGARWTKNGDFMGLLDP